MHLKFWNRDWQTAGCHSGFSHGPHAISWCVAGMWMTTALPAAKHWKRSCSWAGSEMNLGTLAFLDSVFSYFLILSVSLWSSHLYNMLTCLNATLQAARRIAVFDEDTSNCSTLLQIAPLYVIYIYIISMLLAAYCMPLLPSRASLLPGAVKATGSQVPRCWLPSGRVTSCFQAQAGL